ncbi:MAG: hypothetical protein ACLU38_01705 [Dysosmobacter sp.]
MPSTTWLGCRLVGGDSACWAFSWRGKPDPQHPFGHGRHRVYLRAGGDSGLILLMGVELGEVLRGEDPAPEAVDFRSLLWRWGFTGGIHRREKLYMYCHAAAVSGRRISSAAMEARPPAACPMPSLHHGPGAGRLCWWDGSPA